MEQIVSEHISAEHGNCTVFLCDYEVTAPYYRILLKDIEKRRIMCFTKRSVSIIQFGSKQHSAAMGKWTHKTCHWDQKDLYTTDTTTLRHIRLISQRWLYPRSSMLSVCLNLSIQPSVASQREKQAKHKTKSGLEYSPGLG